MRRELNELLEACAHSTPFEHNGDEHWWVDSRLIGPTWGTDRLTELSLYGDEGITGTVQLSEDDIEAIVAEVVTNRRTVLEATADEARTPCTEHAGYGYAAGCPWCHAADRNLRATSGEAATDATD